MKLSEIAAEYLTEKSQRRRITTVAGYTSALRLHVLPRFGACLCTMACSSASGFWLKNRVVVLSGASIATKKANSWSFMGQINVAYGTSQYVSLGYVEGTRPSRAGSSDP